MKKQAAPITKEQEAALALYAEEHGAEWKTKLGVEWMRGSADPELHALRNSHGGAWLAEYELPQDKSTPR